MRQTAVDWLYALSKKRELDIFDLEQAKEKEKEQIIEFFIKGQNTYPSEFVLDNQQIAEQHYNETYK